MQRTCIAEGAGDPASEGRRKEEVETEARQQASEKPVGRGIRWLRRESKPVSPARMDEQEWRCERKKKTAQGPQ